MDKDGLSRKEKLALWRARKGDGGGAKHFQVDKKAATEGESANNHGGVLAERPGAGNGSKRPTSRVSKAKPQRKPFQVDTRIVHEASERRVAPGTPIHSLKKRLRLTEAAQTRAPAQHNSVPAAAKSAVGGDSAANQTARAQAKGKAAAAARVPGHVNGVSRSLDAARTKEVSDYLKSQISEANMLLEIAGVDAARVLLADLLSCTGAARGVGELALYWAARAKLEEDAGMYSVARRILDEGQAYISMPTQQKVMNKVLAAFEARMNDRAEADVAQLLEDSVDTINTSAANSNSPASSTLFRYDPNELSLEDESGGAQSAIKNLNFSKVASSNGGASSGSGDSRVTSPPWSGERGEGMDTCSGASSGGGSSGGVDCMSGVVFSDDDSDLSVSDIDESVIARAEAFHLEEEARRARKEEEDSRNEVGDTHDDDGYPGEIESGLAGRKSGGEAGSSQDDKEEEEDVTSRAPASTAATTAVVQPPKRSAPTAMAPPQAREPRKRKGTPHPKPKRDTPTRSKTATGEVSPGSFIAQVESKGKDGKRTLTPVRRSRRISGVSKEETPSVLRKEMEAML